ncbi:major pollen allergen Ole e 10-like isoform X1 [Musa acuminata AAA Group]|uniref:major pollen allergen Ole e 10-like isoform X1 n=1 Tax=Musa acuminata AAA Group TaxID=214697 RepID=UPI0031D56499
MAGRVRATLSSLLILSSALIFPTLASGGATKVVQGQKTWCVAKPSADEATLAANLNFACSQVDCSVLQWGWTCFYPDTLVSHASIAMNLYYQSKGKNYWNCYFKGSALIVTTDPSESDSLEKHDQERTTSCC